MPRHAASLLLAGLMLVGAAAPSAAQQVTQIVDRPSDNAIIFIHGIAGDPITTFTGANGSWMDLLAADTTQRDGVPDFSGFDIYTVDYSAAFDTTSSLETVGARIASDLGGSEAFKSHGFVWIVAHSMGGLISKRLVIDLQRRPLLANRLVGIFMLGVPGKGSPLAKLGSTGKVDVLLNWFGKNGRLINDLTPIAANTYLETLVNQFADTVEDIRNDDTRSRLFVYCGFETVPEVRYGPIFAQEYSTVVPLLYAESECSGRPEGFTKTHTGLPKPDNRADAVYKWVADQLSESFLRRMEERTVKFDAGQPLERALDFLMRQHNKIDAGTGLRYVPEKISYQSASDEERARGIVFDADYTGPTAAYALENLAAGMACISVEVSEDRKDVTVAVADRGC